MDLWGSVCRSMIPHTGVVVFGREYFFGGGVQRSTHAEFVTSHGLPPVQLLALGTTRVTQPAFEAFLTGLRPRYTAQTYDLLSHNCNNFSDEVVQFLCGAHVRVPAAMEVLDVSCSTGWRLKNSAGDSSPSP